MATAIDPPVIDVGAAPEIVESSTESQASGSNEPRYDADLLQQNTGLDAEAFHNVYVVKKSRGLLDDGEDNNADRPVVRFRQLAAYTSMVENEEERLSVKNGTRAPY